MQELDSLSIDRARLEDWMAVVFDELQRGMALGQNPFAAGIFSLAGQTVSLAHNTVRERLRPSRHAEVNAIDAACVSVGSTKLTEYVLVSSGEPCPLCTAAALQVDVSLIVYGVDVDVIRQAGFVALNARCAELANYLQVHIPVVGHIMEAQIREAMMGKA